MGSPLRGRASTASGSSSASAARRCSSRVLTSQSLFLGAMDVLFVVLAIDELGMGDSGVGILNAAFGAGGLLAVFATLGLVGRRRLAPAIIAAALIMGASIALIAALAARWRSRSCCWRSRTSAAACSTSSGRTLLQRTGSPARARPHLRGAREHRHARPRARLAAGVAAGRHRRHHGRPSSAWARSCRWSCSCCCRPILGADARATVPIVQIGLLRRMPLFRPLPPPELEGVARVDGAAARPPPARC